MELVPEKTQLIVFPHHNDLAVRASKSSINLSLNGITLVPSEEVSHLGVQRSEVPTNVCSILDRISAHRKQLHSLLPDGVALPHGGNPASNLKVDSIYCLPVLLSGLASLLLSKSEVNKLNQCYKTNLTRLMKLCDNTPDCALYFLTGTLPCEAHLHLHQLALFSMICRLKDNIFYELARSSFLGTVNVSHTWFDQIRLLCIE